jgi:hypothetical protein
VDGRDKEMADMDTLKKHIGEVGEKIRQLEGISNENADVINKFTITHITYNEKFDKVIDVHVGTYIEKQMQVLVFHEVDSNK